MSLPRGRDRKIKEIQSRCVESIMIMTPFYSRMFQYLLWLVVLQCIFILAVNNIAYASDTQASLKQGKRLFETAWTQDQGFGHAKGKGPFEVAAGGFPLGFKMISTPRVSSCVGCHSSPFGQAGGSSEIVTNVIVAGNQLRAFIPKHLQQRHMDRGGFDAIINNNATIPVYGAGYVDMLARQITADLQAIRDGLKPGESKALVSKGISFGQLSRHVNGSWDTSLVEGLSVGSTFSSGLDSPPSLLIKAFHQDGSVVSLREFTINAFDFHLGMQATERFGKDADPDGDGVRDELTEADITAITLFQAALPVPGRVIPNNPTAEKNILRGEVLFKDIGCAECHRPSLPLNDKGWVYTEPNPYHAEGNLQAGDKSIARVDLTAKNLPKPRPVLREGIVQVPIFSDFKLHDITSGADDLNQDALNMHTVFGSEEFFAGASRFLTARLWGHANQPPFFHNGDYSTILHAVLAHAGEAKDSAKKFKQLDSTEQFSIIEFLKTLQVLPPNTQYLIVDEKGHEKHWPPLKKLSDYSFPMVIKNE